MSTIIGLEVKNKDTKPNDKQKDKTTKLENKSNK